MNPDSRSGFEVSKKRSIKDLGQIKVMLRWRRHVGSLTLSMSAAEGQTPKPAFISQQLPR
ncbi:hypothetical protein PA257_6660 [Pseudomonas aeruginosa]|nr:hypothetical protein PA257_6660 [Pseudomonas aeruginosa]